MLFLLRKLFCGLQFFTSKLAPQKVFENLGEAVLGSQGLGILGKQVFRRSPGLESLEVIVGENRLRFLEMELRKTSSYFITSPWIFKDST